MFVVFVFFKQKTAYDMRISDWSSDVCSSDLGLAIGPIDRSFTGFSETLWRWRDDVQNDFAARIDWTIKDPMHANHPPVVRLPHADRLTVRSGQRVKIGRAHV